MLLLRTISGLILALAPITLGLFFGLLFYNYQQNVIGIIAICISTFLGILFGIKVFKLVRKIGFIAFITAARTTHHISVNKKKYDK